MLGGFLGAGKTTTLLRLALFLQRSGLRVGIITNDQASGLVDSALAEELDMPVKEIAGGCFCCRSESLVEALDRLQSQNQPHVFLAEPVGSCTDLVATVSLPLERIYKMGFVMAPYTVLVDPYRAMQSLGVEGDPVFSSDVNYIYRKQLEEAEIIAINKVDVISKERLVCLRAALEREYPEARILEIASRDGLGVEELFDLLITEAGQTRQVMEMDYERYAAGEALLGWVNFQGRLAAKVRVDHLDAGSKSQQEEKMMAGGVRNLENMHTNGAVDGNKLLMDLAVGIAGRLIKRGIEVAHLKLSLTRNNGVGGKEEKAKKDKLAGDRTINSRGKGAPETGGLRSCLGRMAAVQWVNSVNHPEQTRRMGGLMTDGHILINLRAEADPDVMAAETLEVLSEYLKTMPGIVLSSLIKEHFRPGRPVPKYRVDAV